MAKKNQSEKNKMKKTNPPVPKQKRIKLKFIRLAQRNIRSIDKKPAGFVRLAKTNIFFR
jgi:hypothetical protein